MPFEEDESETPHTKRKHLPLIGTGIPKQMHYSNLQAEELKRKLENMIKRLVSAESQFFPP